MSAGKWGESMHRAITLVALADGMLFVAMAIWRALHAMPGGWMPVYEALAALGLVLGVYGFVLLIRFPQQHLRTATLCVLFALAPGCQALVSLLSWLGGQPV
ncbi:hypothetical protein [Alicyclobacillus shizuokensis]|uniref:hypothetical protein n=1 Tax=Alicyclobacillus shizuokensis TaxID=392014 RepID=UPI00082F6394|nr:hypothetical protein [Alicyclobacillus shizuokensis]MCL6625669.1 hypothetical protein [Alicyclobacillus shizuokensis]